MNLIYREYTENDVGQVISLMDQFQDYLVQLDPEKRLRLLSGYGEKKVAEMLEKIEKEHGAIFVAEENEQIVGFIAGITAPPGRRMGHAGAIISGSSGTAEAKTKALEAAGIPVARLPSEIVQLLK